MKSSGQRNQSSFRENEEPVRGYCKPTDSKSALCVYHAANHYLPTGEAHCNVRVNQDGGEVREMFYRR